MRFDKGYKPWKPGNCSELIEMTFVEKKLLLHAEHISFLLESVYKITQKIDQICGKKNPTGQEAKKQ